MADGPKTRLDRIARDLSRTWLHGSRVTDNAGHTKPATVATAQQIQVDLPTTDMKFQFQASGGARANVLVPHDFASNSETAMTSALGTDRAKYLTLDTDDSVPTWVFSQRGYSFPNPMPDEDRITVPDPSTAGAALTVVQLPDAALGEVQQFSDIDCFASLEQYDESTKLWSTIARSNWQPAIMLRFNLKTLPPNTDVPSGMQIFELEGTPQGDRYYLDHLGLLDAYLGTTADPNPPDVQAVSLAVQQTTKGATTRIDDWTIVRTNLTREARSGARSAAFATAAAPAALPYVAVAGAGLDQDKDAVRLLQMISITNSGGYYLRAATSVTCDTLVLTILLNSKADSGTGDSTLLWRAANAVALKPNTNPDSIRFNGLAHIQIAPAVPSGNVVFGWTRTQLDNPTAEEDKFGYGTISLVDYEAVDGAGNPVGNFSQDTCIAISPSQQLPGKMYDRHRPMTKSGAASGEHLHSGNAAAMQLLPRHRRDAVSALTAPAPGFSLRYYRSTLTCYDATTESPYARIADPARSKITFTPGFRDVFGNRFDAAAAPPVRRRLFYTDALVPPSEWPGIRFAVYPGLQGGKPYLYLEMQYRYLGTPPSKEKEARIQRLTEIRAQLNGANADVEVTFQADPLLSGPFTLKTVDLTSTITDWIDKENKNSSADLPPLVKPLAAIPCSGQVDDVKQFKPELTVTRTKTDYLPSATELPKEAALAQQIQSQIRFASAPVALQTSTANPPPVHALEQLGARTAASRSDDEFRVVAKAFQDSLAVSLKMTAGFLRDSQNQHELWFVPNAFFPTAPDPATYAVWSFATARPLSNKLHSETFDVPDFTTTCSGSGPDCWRKHPISRSQTFIDQDFDVLGRVAFGFIEKESVGLAAITAKANVDAARTLLSEREQIALALASFAGDGPGYLVPLYAKIKPGDIDQAGVVRATRDAFLNDLTAFYGVDTVMQLPLTSAGSSNILTFEGTVTAGFPLLANPPPAPIVSSILLGGGDQKVTVLYDLPPGTTEPTAVQKLAALTASLHHVQLQPEDKASAGNNLFNQGRWLELVKPWPLQWKAPSDFVPVASRQFPNKPVLQSTEVLMPWRDPQTGKVTPPAINASNAGRLAQWGWQFQFGLLDATTNDTVHVTTRYNEPSSSSNAARRFLAATMDWTPISLLNSLVAVKLLQDNAGGVPEPDRLQITAELATALRKYLAAPATLRSLADEFRPQDHFAIHAPGDGPSPTTPPDEDGGRAIMKGAIGVKWSDPGTRPRVATAVALADSANNNAFLTGASSVRNYRASLRLLRNEKFGPGRPQQPADPSLVYECAPVESPRECWAQNMWPPLKYDYDKTKGLQSALGDFFKGLFQQTNLSAMDIEIDAALAWSIGMLTDAVTPFSILPTDLKQGNGSPDAVAAFVFQKCQILLAAGAPADVSPALRLRVKLATPDGSTSRTLLDIGQIDFAL